MVVLTEKEDKAFQLLLAGKTMRETAMTLNVSYNRVVALLNAVLIKTGCRTRRELMVNGRSIKYKIKGQEEYD